MIVINIVINCYNLSFEKINHNQNKTHHTYHNNKIQYSLVSMSIIFYINIILIFLHYFILIFYIKSENKLFIYDLDIKWNIII